jgi:transcriptional regulator with XRE-family HTH domain
MKQTLSQAGFRLRALRRSRHRTQESLAAECRQCGFAVTRQKLANYEIGLTDVPARFIPIIARILEVDITDLLPPIGGNSESQHASVRTNVRNLTGQQIRAFRRNRKWSQSKLATAIQEMGAPMTREIIANLETQRTRVKDYELVLFAKALKIPVDSLFAGSANLTDATHVLRRNAALGNPFPNPNKTRSISRPFALIARKIRKFAKRLIAQR